MRDSKYIEGKTAVENFEQGMKALFKVPKEKVVRAEKRKKNARASRRRKQKHSDGG